MDARTHAIKAIYGSILLNFLLALVKGATGYFGNSYALIADGIESTADIFSSVILLAGIHYSTKPADKNHPYGHGRAEPLLNFIVVGFLVVSAVIIIIKSIENIRHPHQLPATYTLAVLALIVLIKEFYFRFMLKKSKLIHSSTLEADAWHHRSDAITSGAAFVGISIALFLGKGYEAADDWAALIAAGVILFNAYRLFRQALGEIMDEDFYDEMVSEIRRLALKVDGVVDTEKCYVRKTGANYRVELHALVDASISVKAGHDIAHRLKKFLQTEIPHLADVLIHIEPS